MKPPIYRHRLYYLDPSDFILVTRQPRPRNKAPLYYTRHANAYYYWPKVRVPGYFTAGLDTMIGRTRMGRIFVELA